jgi:EF-hand domain pair
MGDKSSAQTLQTVRHPFHERSSMSLFKQALPFLAGAFILASTAYGQDAKPQGGASRDLEKQFKSLDRNGDGFVSKEELMSDKSLSGSFNSADKNRDGKLDMSEFQGLEANRSPDRSLGSVAPQEKDQAAGAGGTGPNAQRPSK